MRAEAYEKRFRDFPEPIQELFQESPVVARVIQLYAHGDIITKEEALCRMVIELSKDVEHARRNMIEMMSRSAIPGIVYPGKGKDGA